jgi:hypothetical protein
MIAPGAGTALSMVEKGVGAASSAIGAMGGGAFSGPGPSAPSDYGVTSSNVPYEQFPSLPSTDYSMNLADSGFTGQ